MGRMGAPVDMISFINEQRVCSWLGPLCIAAIISAATYLQVAVSEEFSPFAPLPVESTVYFPAAAIVGFLAFWAAEGMDDVSQLKVLALLIIIPVLSYGGLALVLWTIIAGDTALFDLFILRIGQHAIIYVAITGPLKGIGMMIGVIVFSLYRH